MPRGTRQPKASSSRLPSAPSVAPTPIATPSNHAASGNKGKGKQRAIPNPTDSLQTKKKPKKTRFRTVVVPSDSDSDSDSAGRDPFHLSDAAPDDALKDKDAGVRAEDGDARSFEWWDPRSLPRNGPNYRTAKQLRLLEHATFKSALYDVAVDRMDLAKALLEWEAIRRKRRRSEGDGDQAHRGSPGQHDEPMHLDGADIPGPRRPRLADEPPDPVLPTSLYLSQMARWPIPIDDLPPSPAIIDEIAALVAAHTRRIRRVMGRDRPKRRMKHRPRSAYEPEAPLARPLDPEKVVEGRNHSLLERASTSTERVDRGREAEDDGDEEEEDDYWKEEESGASDSSLFEDSDALSSSLDDEDLEDLPFPTRKVIGILGDTLDGVLAKLANLVPPGGFPARDVWDRRKRKHPSRNAKAMGWETVLDIVKKDDNLPPQVAGLLQKRLEAVYGSQANNDLHPSDGILEPPRFSVSIPTLTTNLHLAQRPAPIFIAKPLPVHIPRDLISVDPKPLDTAKKRKAVEDEPGEEPEDASANDPRPVDEAFAASEAPRILNKAKGTWKPGSRGRRPAWADEAGIPKISRRKPAPPMTFKWQPGGKGRPPLWALASGAVPPPKNNPKRGRNGRSRGTTTPNSDRAGSTREDSGAPFESPPEVVEEYVEGVPIDFDAIPCLPSLSPLNALPSLPATDAAYLPYDEAPFSSAMLFEGNELTQIVSGSGLKEGEPLVLQEGIPTGHMDIDPALLMLS